MQLIDILKDDSFKDSQIIAGQNGLSNEVESAMILEASDIENWGQKNQLILSSYFALANLDDKGLEDFYMKMKTIGISGLIIKPKRLIDEVPQKLVNLSNLHSIPLILINPTVKYEQIIMSVLQPIINNNTMLLNSYYNYRQHFSKMSFTDLNLQEIVNQLKTMFHSEIQIELLGSNFLLNTFQKIPLYKETSINILEKHKFISHNYIARTIKYSNSSIQTILSVYIPTIDNKPYLLSIFKNPNTINNKEFMLVENAVEHLKTFFLIEHSIKKEQFFQKNNQMVDLLFNINLSNAEVNQNLISLNIDEKDYYQIVICSIKSHSENINKFIESIILKVKNICPLVAFLQKNEDVFFLFNIHENEKLIEKDFISLLNLDTVLHISIGDVFKFGFYNETRKLEKLKNFLSVIYNQSISIEYSNLGFYKLFLNIDNIDDLKEYVPSMIQDIVVEKPELAKTLEVFLDNSKNYVRTGEIMYIHPKTVRYRIEKISDTIHLDLDNAHQVLTVHVALKVCSYANII